MKKALLLISVAALACGKQTFLAAAFVQTPALPNPTGGAGFPQFQVLTAYFGTIDTTDPTKISSGAMAAITDAEVGVSFHHVADTTVPGDVDEDRWIKQMPPWQQSQGTYTLNSKDEPRLTFEPGVPYTLVLQLRDANGKPNGEAYGARFTPGPHEEIAEFKNSTCTVGVPPFTTQAPRCKDGSLAQPLTLTRTDTGSGPLLPAFVVVGSVDPNNPSAQPQITYKTVPADAVSLLKYVLSDQQYRVQSFTVPATAFPSAGYYLVTILVVNQGKVSSNAFLGSTALAGSGAAGIYHVQ